MMYQLAFDGYALTVRTHRDYVATFYTRGHGWRTARIHDVGNCDVSETRAYKQWEQRRMRGRPDDGRRRLPPYNGGDPGSGRGSWSSLPIDTTDRDACFAEAALW